MAEHPGFLQAVIEAPDDDAPRLIYADWLEDHGDPERAEFIRLQCRPDPRRAGRAGALLGAHHPRWLAPLLELGLKERPFRAALSPGCEFTFTRGFVSEITTFGRVTARSLLGAIGLVLSRTPLDSLVFKGYKPPELRRLLDGPVLARLRELTLRSNTLSATDGRWLREAFGDRLAIGPLADEDIVDVVDIPF
jgi:uncharacterized protein (TIGR02996 family)